jgi:hypothetical protein
MQTKSCQSAGSRPWRRPSTLQLGDGQGVASPSAGFLAHYHISPLSEFFRELYVSCGGLDTAIHQNGAKR